MTRLKRLAGAIVMASLASLPARADYTVRDYIGDPTLIKAGTLFSGQLPWMTLVDQNGNAQGVAANPLAIGFGNGVLLPAFASPPTVNIGTTGTIPVSAAAWPLPAGAAISAKQPALGTSGAPSADVLTVQGAVGMTPFKVDGSAVTQPISVASLPLPTGAATQATLASILSALGSPFQAGGQVRLFDNASGQQATIKPASSAPSASDPALAVALSPNFASPAQGLPVKDGTWVSAGAMQPALPISGVTVLTVPTGATKAFFTLENGSIRRTSDGSTPAVGLGTLLNAGTWEDSGPLSAYKFYPETGNPILTVEYEK